MILPHMMTFLSLLLSGSPTHPFIATDIQRGAFKSRNVGDLLH